MKAILAALKDGRPHGRSDLRNAVQTTNTVEGESFRKNFKSALNKLTQRNKVKHDKTNDTVSLNKKRGHESDHDKAIKREMHDTRAFSSAATSKVSGRNSCVSFAFPSLTRTHFISIFATTIAGSHRRKEA